MRPKKSSTRSKNYYKIILRVFLVGILIFFIFWVKDSLFTFKVINCQIDGRDCPEEIITKLKDQYLGKSLISVQDNSISDFVNSQGFLVSNTAFQKNWLKRSADFNFTARKPIAYIKDNRINLIDKDGVVIGESSHNLNLPQIIPDFSLDPLINGEKFNQDEIKYALDILTKLKLYSFEPTKADIQSKFKIEITLLSGEQVVFSTMKEAAEQLDSLQLIFTRAKIEGKHISRIDLRFDKPVLLYD
jgi:hypothetical protein